MQTSLVISNQMQQNQLRSKIKIAYDKTQSRLKSVENRASIPGPVGSPGYGNTGCGVFKQGVQN